MLDVNRMVDAVLSAVGAPILALAKRVAALEERAPKDGAEGPRGEPGPAGRDGEAGPAGADGAPGERGEIGPMGERGADGAAGRAGPIGPDGIDGEPGRPGERGDAGKDGVGIAGALIGRDGNLAVTLSDGNIASLGAVVGRDGAPGPKGDAGDRGEQGLPGDRGEKGESGIDGKDGAPGISAEMPLAPDDVAEQVAKAMKLVAESPTVAAKGSAVVLNINSAQKSTKTITTRRDKDGNLVADVVENRG